MKEIIIYANPENSNYEKGLFFEKLIVGILNQQRFNVDERVNYTGMEIDMVCKHLDRGETAFVECKAKESLSANDIKIFSFEIGHRNADYGYFIYTKKYEHQVAGLIDEITKKNNKIYFWNAEKVIQLLEGIGFIKNPNYVFNSPTISKEILLYSYVGTFYVVLLSDATVPKYFCIYNAKTGDTITESDSINHCKEIIKEINALQQYITVIDKKQSIEENQSTKSKVTIEAVAEIQEAESWDDYKPASSKYFVGRKKIRESLLIFFDEIIKRKTSKRIFYIDGKSGWGKSSLLNELKARCRNKFYKNKFYTLVIDSRSAHTNNFVALSFKKILENASKVGFIKEDFTKVSIPSAFNILDYENFKDLEEYLDENNRLLILVFDQFEDFFRKGNLFEPFYKFLIDIRNKHSNIVLGFSWKSEINVPINHPAYHLWQQSKDYTECFTLPEFDFGESKSIIKQLERAINEKLEIDFTRKIIDNSQGYPWLVKKLCIHIYKQYKNKSALKALYEQDFNVETLFKDDLEELGTEEVRALKYIAKRAYNDDAFNVTEIDDKISGSIIDSLIHKRMVIKSGTKYNIYWDIFRDYLVTNEIPKIGENYLIRQFIQPVAEMFLIFKEKHSYTLKEIMEYISYSMKEGTVLNILRELRNINLLTYQDEKFILKKDIINVTEESFKELLNNKLRMHSIYYEIIKNKLGKLELNDLKLIIRNKFKGKKFSDKTLTTYIQMFISWCSYANIDLPEISPYLIKQALNIYSYTPQKKPLEVLEYFLNLSDGSSYPDTKKEFKLLYDLKSLGLLYYVKKRIYLTPIGKQVKELSKEKIAVSLCTQAIKTEKILFSYNIIKERPLLKSKEFKKEIADLLIGINSKVYENLANRNLYSWAKFVYDKIN